MSPIVVALIIALSPFAVIPSVLLLLAHDPRRTAGAFLLGWFAGILLLTALAVLLSDLVEAWQAPDWFRWIRGAIGVLLVLMGLRSLLSRAPSGGGWSARLVGITPSRATGLGALLAAANPKVIALAAAGGLAIGSARDSLRDEVLAVLAFSAIASLGVALPLAVHALAGQRADRWLRTAEGWLERRGDQAMGVVLLLIGAYLLADVAF